MSSLNFNLIPEFIPSMANNAVSAVRDAAISGLSACGQGLSAISTSITGACAIVAGKVGTVVNGVSKTCYFVADKIGESSSLIGRTTSRAYDSIKDRANREINSVIEVIGSPSNSESEFPIVENQNEIATAPQAKTDAISKKMVVMGILLSPLILVGVFIFALIALSLWLIQDTKFMETMNNSLQVLNKYLHLPFFDRSN